ncbi:hypothetical protein CBR_g190 [Chara braunii]|uniref:Uncharacterized protein n=1 Tax=Chara braunii TaxID=69332 RepID=A0A388JLU0_CHABU|nr:hypothetical protein CBR_g190 [Chara braunii]|eukprot:GBG58790.1 hypothetical protein CBR_g190 [Chara braunii]
MEVAAGRSLSTCCTCLRRVDTDGRVQCAECLDKSIMRACARRSGGRGNALFSSSSSSSQSSSSQRSDPRRSSSSSSSVHFSSSSSSSSSSTTTTSSSSSSSCSTCPAGGRDPCPHDNPFASAVRYLPFPGRPRVVMIKNRNQAPAAPAAPPLKGNYYPRNAAATAAAGICAGSTRLAPTACPEVAVPRDTLRLNSGGCQHHASGERGGGGNALGGAGKPSAWSGHGGAEAMGKRIAAAAESAAPGEVPMAILSAKNPPARACSAQTTLVNATTKTKTKVMPSLSKAVSMVDRTAAAMMSAAEQARSEPTAAMKKVRLRHSRGGGSISSFMTVGGADEGFLDEILSSFSAPCSPGDRKGEEERGSTKQGGSTSPLWERRCFTRPAMLEINSVAVPV